MRHMVRALFVGLVAATWVACSSSPSSPSSGANLNINITDSPFSDAKALLVTFSEVSAHIASSTAGNFTTLPFSGGATSRTCDLKKLTSNATDVLGTGTLTAGHYTQIRLTVSSAVIYLDNASTSATPCAATIAAPAGASANVTIPSGQLILNREFDVPTAGATTILLDFDGDQSVRLQGNGQYSMTPVVTIKSVS